MLTLQPVRFPRPTPIPRWTDDYSDIGERISRNGYLDCEEIWLPASGDGWASFCGRHGTDLFLGEWVSGVYDHWAHSWPQKASAPPRERWRTEIEQQQQTFEAERREREAAKQRQADAEWAAEAQRRSNAQTGDDIGWWMARNPGYARQPFFQIVAPQTGEIDGFQFVAGRTDMVPATIMQMMR